MNYADIKFPDIANGIGCRVSLFVSGCTRNCPECFNKEVQDFKYGKPFTADEVIKIIKKLDLFYVQGLTILGGEPLELSNAEELAKLVQCVKARFPAKDIWLYTGDTFEKEVLEKYNKYKFMQVLLDRVDVLVDGEFQIENKRLDLRFRGSSNQRILDLQESLKTGKAVELEI